MIICYSQWLLNSALLPIEYNYKLLYHIGTRNFYRCGESEGKPMKPRTCGNSEPLEPDRLQSATTNELMQMILIILERNKNVWFLTQVYIRARNLEKLIHS